MSPLLVMAPVIAGVFGLVVGSYLNVVVHRLPRGLSTVTPRSACPRCGHVLAWFDNVPVLSWVALRGRCRACGEPISPRYMVLELVTAGLFVAAVLVFGPSWNAVRIWALAAFLVPLTAIDLELWLLPLELTLPGIAVGVLSSIPLGRAALLECAVGAVVGFGIFWALERLLEALLRREGLGAGDKYLLALIAGFLGWRALFPVLLLSNVQGAVVGLLLLLLRGRAGPAAPEPPSPEEDDGWRPGATHLPFGPWLSLAALEVALLLPLFRDFIPLSLLPLLGGQSSVLP